MLHVTKRLLDFHNIQNRIRSKLIWNTIFCSWLALTQIQRKPCAQHTYWRLWNAPNISYYSYSLTLSVSVSLSLPSSRALEYQGGQHLQIRTDSILPITILWNVKTISKTKTFHSSLNYYCRLLIGLYICASHIFKAMNDKCDPLMWRSNQHIRTICGTAADASWNSKTIRRNEIIYFAKNIGVE